MTKTTNSDTSLKESADESMSVDPAGANGSNDAGFSIALPINIATISSGFEKGDFLVREIKGQRVYFDFFEEAFNYLANKGYSSLPAGKRDEWMNAVGSAHASIANGTRYNTGSLLMVLSRPVDVNTIYQNSTLNIDGSAHGNKTGTDDNGIV